MYGVKLLSFRVLREYVVIELIFWEGGVFLELGYEDRGFGFMK